LTDVDDLVRDKEILLFSLFGEVNRLKVECNWLVW